nr:hypothetical protein [Mesorhizobium sp.]
MSMRQAFANLRLDFSSTQQAEYQVERESQQQADMLVFAYFAALASIGGLYVLFSLANDMFGLSARMGWRGFPELYAIGRNLFAVFCEYISVGLGMFIVFSYRRNRIEDNEWFQTSDADNDPKKVAAGSYVSAGAILAGFFIASFLLLDIVVPLGSGNACSVGWTPACSNLVFEKITTFPERNWMRVVYGVAVCLLIVGFLDRVGRSEGRARQSRRLAVVVTVAATLEFLGKLNLEIASLRQPLVGPMSILSNIDKGYLVLVGCSAIVFWGVFGARAYHRLRWSAVRDLDAKTKSHRIEETPGLVHDKG